VKLPEPLLLNRRYESLVEVRGDRVTGYLDGRKVIEWRTDYQEMAQDGYYHLPNPRALGVGIWLGKTTFHDIAVREVTGHGKLLRSSPPTPSAALPGTPPPAAAR
jgi:hypothetical protein